MVQALTWIGGAAAIVGFLVLLLYVAEWVDVRFGRFLRAFVDQRQFDLWIIWCAISQPRARRSRRILMHKVLMTAWETDREEFARVLPTFAKVDRVYEEYGDSLREEMGDFDDE